MSTVPRKYPEAIAWVNTHVPIWTAAAATIGLDPTQPVNLGALATEAADAKAAYDTAKSEADTLYEAYQTKAKAMRTQATAQVGQIRSFAKGSANPQTVYTAAQIPAPAEPTPRPAPGTPVVFTVGLDQSGALNVKFKCPNPPRVGSLSYIVERSLGAQQPFTYLKTAAERAFEDDTVPNGTGDVTYRVTAQSPTKKGAPGYFTVRFGVNNQPQIISQGTSESKAG
ncbi:MAG: hypothetical protein RIB58_06860 [Phycisphaerales bacterium]